jgi:hypothetical protein
MSARQPTKRQLHAHALCDHALEILRDRGTDKKVPSYPVKEVIADPFTVWHSITGVDVWHEGSGKVLTMVKRDPDRYEIVTFHRGAWEDAFLQL